MARRAAAGEGPPSTRSGCRPTRAPSASSAGHGAQGRRALAPLLLRGRSAARAARRAHPRSAASARRRTRPWGPAASPLDSDERSAVPPRRLMGPRGTASGSAPPHPPTPPSRSTAPSSAEPAHGYSWGGGPAGRARDQRAPRRRAPRHPSLPRTNPTPPTPHLLDTRRLTAPPAAAQRSAHRSWEWMGCGDGEERGARVAGGGRGLHCTDVEVVVGRGACGAACGGSSPGR